MEVPNNFSSSSFLLLRRLGRQRRFLVRVRIWLPIPWYARLEVVALALPGLAQAYLDSNQDGLTPRNSVPVVLVLETDGQVTVQGIWPKISIYSRLGGLGAGPNTTDDTLHRRINQEAKRTIRPFAISLHSPGGGQPSKF
ncbi:hypothetical protein N656DRAFT_498618 [Canariomyces notabilis]|uniref:Uncharacterized protein n=1 Tax=Canariomyces notabilis TaxID=2074819 RepID=A0AAN6TJ07_9PEZI|nr:hypothetical protein N656DRAFT_498618 [Canariomyces arenarius]